MIKYYALVVEGDVFYLTAMDLDHPVAAKWSAALESDIFFLNIDNYAQVKPGFLYNQNNFYDPEDIKMQNALPQLPTENDGVTQYAGIVGNDVVGLITFHKTDFSEELWQMINIGFQSNPTVVDYTNNKDKNSIVAGWTWDGENFYPPIKE